jgi:hypothetical protein
MSDWKRIRIFLSFLLRDASLKHSVNILPVNGGELAAAITTDEYKRLLFWPRSRELEGDLLDRANFAREWYANHGQPFAASCRVDVTNIDSPNIQLSNGETLSSARLAERLNAGDARSIVVLAATAGAEVQEEVARHWKEGRPDEAFFLDRFAVGVTEQLVRWASAYLCRESEPSHETLLPHLSPGCGNWDLQDQQKLMSLLSDNSELGPMQLLPTGALDPKHSLMAALGVTHRKFEATPKDICRSCDLTPCSFRRAPYIVDRRL